MANKKIRMNEKRADGTFNTLHPETTVEQVINPNTGESILEHFVDTTKKHIELVDEIPANLVGKGVFFEKQGGVSDAPNKPTIQDVYDQMGELWEEIMSKEFVIETRTSDPVSPEVGRIWIREDL